MTDELQSVEVVFLGERLAGDGSMCMTVITRDQLEMLINANAGSDTIEYAASLFSLKRGVKMPRQVGGVYVAEVKVDGDGKIRTIVTGGLKWTRDGGYELAGVWKASDTAAKMRKQAKLEEAKAGKDDALETAIGSLIWHYRRMGAQNRNAFKLMLLDRLEKGK